MLLQVLLFNSHYFPILPELPGSFPDVRVSVQYIRQISQIQQALSSVHQDGFTIPYLSLPYQLISAQQANLLGHTQVESVTLVSI
jgi:hypothetical protein